MQDWCGERSAEIGPDDLRDANGEWPAPQRVDE